MAAKKHQQKDDDDGQEPAHHARRPMNAFLIFCKRHRASVRSGFPNLENRAVTRVLGEWWAMLNNEQKKAYTNLAQEYKDAFLNANPDFKWYKLPAPPLRTLNTRPTNKKQEIVQAKNNAATITSNEYYNMEQVDEEEESIQPGKLADESQIGGLSSLFTPCKVNAKHLPVPLEAHSCQVMDINDVPKPPKKRYLESPPSNESKQECKSDLFGEKRSKKESNNNCRQINIEEEQISSQLYDNSLTSSVKQDKNFEVLQSKNISLIHNQSKQSQITSLSNTEKHRERRNSISSNISEKTESLSSEGTSSRGELEHLVEAAEGKLEASKPEDTETEGAEGQPGCGAWISRKIFKAEDFNLEKKIEALPSLSLEEFQEMKKQQRTKKKKIFQKAVNSKKGEHEGMSKKLDRVQCNDESLTGTQKKKIKKHNTSNQVGISADVSKVVEDQSWCQSPGLEALACLAAVAANRTKLTKP